MGREAQDEDLKMNGTHISHHCGKTDRHVTELLTSIPIGGAKVSLSVLLPQAHSVPPPHEREAYHQAQHCGIGIATHSGNSAARQTASLDSSRGVSTALGGRAQNAMKAAKPLERRPPGSPAHPEAGRWRRRISSRAKALSTSSSSLSSDSCGHNGSDRQQQSVTCVPVEGLCPHC